MFPFVDLDLIIGYRDSSLHSSHHDGGIIARGPPRVSACGPRGGSKRGSWHLGARRQRKRSPIKQRAPWPGLPSPPRPSSPPFLGFQAAHYRASSIVACVPHHAGHIGLSKPTPSPGQSRGVHTARQRFFRARRRPHHTYPRPRGRSCVAMVPPLTEPAAPYQMARETSRLPKLRPLGRGEAKAKQTESHVSAIPLGFPKCALSPSCMAAPSRLIPAEWQLSAVQTTHSAKLPVTLPPPFPSNPQDSELARRGRGR